MKKVMLLIGMGLLLNGCVTENKAVGLSNGVGGFKLEVVGSATTGSYPMPQIWVAGDTFSYGSAPAIDKDKTAQIVFTMAKRRSFFGSLFGVDDVSMSMTYIGTPGETADDTVKRLKALTSVVSDTPITATTTSTVENIITETK